MATTRTLRERTTIPTYHWVTRRYAVFSFFMALLLRSSCSKIEEAMENNEAQTENILVEESPWAFSRY